MYNWNDGTDVLVHHGIKGQKWGERRFQNDDGSLTVAGRQRYGVGTRLTNMGKNLGGLATRALAENKKRRNLSNYQNKDGSFNAAGKKRFNIQNDGYKDAYKKAQSDLKAAKAATRVEMKRQQRKSFEDIDDSALDKVFDNERAARATAKQAKIAYKNSDEYRHNKRGEQAAWKAQRREAIRNTSRGARIGVYLLSGPIGLYNYNSLRASGVSGGSAAAQAIVLNSLTGGLGNLVYSSIIGDKEKNKY